MHFTLNKKSGIYILSKDQKIIFFDPENLFVFVPKNQKNKIDENIKNYLYYKNNNIQEQNTPDIRYSSINEISSLGVEIHISNDCNLRCSYCYGDGGSYGEQRGKIKKETIDQLIVILQKNFTNLKKIHVGFIGGETYLYPDLIQYAINNFKKNFKGKKLNFGGPTNGTILNNKLHTLFKEHNFGIAISLDGPQKSHDKLRKYLNGQGSYDTIIANLDKFKLLSNKIHIRSTINKHNLNLVNSYLHFKKLGISIIKYFPVSTSKNNSFYLDNNDINKLLENYTLLAKKYLSDVINEKTPLKIKDFTDKLKLIHLKNKKKYYCGFGRKMIAVSYKGDIYPCHRFVGKKNYLIGNVYTNLETNKMYDFQQQLHVDKIDKCISCIAKYMCGGGCYHDGYIENGALNPSDNLCKIIKHITYLSIWLYSELISHKDKLKTLIS